MKKLSYLIVIVLISSLVLTGCLLSNVGQVPASQQSGISDIVKNGDGSLGNVNLTSSGVTDSGHFPEIWDLTACDMTISFTYYANNLVDDDPDLNDPWGNGGDHAWAQMGIRQIGYGDFNPTFGSEGAGIWLATDYHEKWVEDPPESGNWVQALHNTFELDPPGSPTLDLDDKLILQKAGGHGEGDYNLPSAPPAPGNNHRVWWDRDGVDPWQNGATANTNGIYNVVIKLHATTVTSGTAYMTIKGLDQGFETDGNWNTIELTPAGMTFTGDMTKMQVFYGLFGYGANHSVSFNNISVNGCLTTIEVPIDIKPMSCPNPLNVKSQGVLPVAILGTVDFNVNDIDPTSVKLEGVTCIKWAVEDVTTPYEPLGIPNCLDCSTNGPDGFLDLILHFNTQEIINKLENENLSTGDIDLLDIVTISASAINDGDCVLLTLTGNLFNEAPIIKGEDSVLILKKGK